MRRSSLEPLVDRAAALALIALAVALPFELTRPAVQAGPFWITTVELLMYVALGLALAAAGLRARSLERVSLPIGAAIIALWIAVMLASAALAREPRSDALKFALRSIAAAGLAFAAARATDLPWARGAILAGLAAGATVAAGLGAAEGLFPPFAGVLSPFRTQSFSLSGYPRAMGTFQYPTIAAMFWEAAAPIAVGLAALIPIRSLFIRAGLAGLAGVVFGVAVAATLSRAGAVVAAVALLALAVIAWLRFRPSFAPAVAGLAGFGLAALAFLLTSPALGARLQAESDTALSRADVTLIAFPSAALISGAPFTLSVEVTNRGIEAWPASGPRAIVASYHWVDEDRTTYLLFEGARTALPIDVAPGAAVRLDLRGFAPGGAGRRVLQVDLQRGDGAWFTQKGNSMPEVAVEIVAATEAPSALPQLPVSMPRAYVPPAEQGEVGRLELWRVALAMAAERPVLGVGPDNFRHLYGAYLNRRDFNTSIHANSLYFDTLANLGVAGLAAMLALGAAIAARLVAAFRGSHPDRSSWMAAVALVSLAAFFAHGTLDYFLEFTPTLGLFWLLAGCAARPRGSASPA